MLRDIEHRKRDHRRGAWIGTVFFAGLQAVCALSFGALCLIPGLPGWLFWMFAVLAGGCLVPILPVLWLLKKRMEELEGGELDAAAEY